MNQLVKSCLNVSHSWVQGPCGNAGRWGTLANAIPSDSMLTSAIRRFWVQACSRGSPPTWTRLKTCFHLIDRRWGEVAKEAFHCVTKCLQILAGIQAHVMRARRHSLGFITRIKLTQSKCSPQTCQSGRQHSQQKSHIQNVHVLYRFFYSNCGLERRRTYEMCIFAPPVEIKLGR